EHTLRRLGKMKDRFPVIGDIRGRGLLLGVELVRPDHPMEPDADSARQIAVAALKQGVILLASGRAGNVISLTPPLTITKEQLDFALGVLEDCLARL
ncbi:MAG: aminotransferase class III-fold pyridoxal phosphate-dependent enzyme, partial [Acidimicrobiia bacterium]